MNIRALQKGYYGVKYSKIRQNIAKYVWVLPDVSFVANQQEVQQ
jgi:hypothetical protein